MALTPNNSAHKNQIEAGTKGRNKGHKFEVKLTSMINELDAKSNPICQTSIIKNLVKGNPAIELLQYISNDLKCDIYDVEAWCVGGLATSGSNSSFNSLGVEIKHCKSDVLIKLHTSTGEYVKGVSVKTCSKKTPSNAQLFFTTATAFCTLLETNRIKVSPNAKEGLSKFCGDKGLTPKDLLSQKDLNDRLSDPKRFYWEELDLKVQQEWEDIFNTHQDKITLLLLQKAYNDDPYPPEFILHQTRKYEEIDNVEVALYSMEEFTSCSRNFNKFHLSDYIIRKGTYKNDPITHKAPRFGFIQFQRGGQKQHPTQLQFNLKAGYFKNTQI